jgi:hypothetical protein
MPGFMPGIHVLSQKRDSEDVDGRDIGVRKHAVLRTAMPGHDDERTKTSVSRERAEVVPFFGVRGSGDSDDRARMALGAGIGSPFPPMR